MSKRRHGNSQHKMKRRLAGKLIEKGDGIEGVMEMREGEKGEKGKVRDRVVEV